VGGRAGDPRCRAGQWTAADYLVHYQVFATTVDAALTVDDMSDMMRLLRITQAHVRLTRAIR
jgi:hypothetical protein